MLEAYGEALGFLFAPTSLLTLLIAVLAGLIIGVIPGIGGMVACTLVLVLIFRLPPDIALLAMVAIHTVTYTGGSVTAILLNIPGTPTNAATLIDGFPMNERGEGSRAIGAAVTSSMVGGILPTFLALATIPLLLPILMAFRSPEMAMLILVGLTFMAALTGESPTRGLISGAVGLLLATIGFQGLTGVHRFSFGSRFLWEGLSIVPVALGIFGLGEMLDLITKGRSTIARGAVAAKLSDAFAGARDVWYHKWMWLRCTIIGYVVGLLPGVGAETSIFVAYGHAKQTSKNPEKFGTGCVEGVIAPEAANNAKEAGAVLTTMAFGIPGSAVMGILLAAFIMVGVTPGPRMLVENLPLAFTLLLGLALANLIGGLITLFTAPYLARVALVDIHLLFPVIIIVIMCGAYLVDLSVGNLIIVVLFGLLGLLMKRNAFSRPALILGFVLGGLFEDYVMVSIKTFGPTFFLTPLSLSLLAIIIFLITYPRLKPIFAHWFQRIAKRV